MEGVGNISWRGESFIFYVGNQMNYPIAVDLNGDGDINRDVIRNIYSKESNHYKDFYVGRKSYFVLSDGGDADRNRYILEHNQIDTSNNKITFREFQHMGGDYEVAYVPHPDPEIEGKGNITFRNRNFTFYIDSEYNYDLSVDLNGSGDINGDQIANFHNKEGFFRI